MILKPVPNRASEIARAAYDACRMDHVGFARFHPVQSATEGIRKPAEYLPNDMVFLHFMDRNHPKHQRLRQRGKAKRWAIR